MSRVKLPVPAVLLLLQSIFFSVLASAANAKSDAKSADKFKVGFSDCSSAKLNIFTVLFEKILTFVSKFCFLRKIADSHQSVKFCINDFL